MLVKLNRRLVAGIANTYRSRARGLELEDLIQEGTIGLLAAIDHFDCSAGGRLSSYAVPSIKRHITASIIDSGALIRLPAHIAARQRQVRQAAASLEAKTGRVPSAEALAQVCALTVERVRETLGLPVVVASLDQQVTDEEDDKLADLLPGAAQDTEEVVSSSDWIKETLSVLRPRERRVLECRLGLDGGPEESLTEVARRLRMSREGVRLVEQRALAKLLAVLPVQ